MSTTTTTTPTTATTASTPTTASSSTSAGDQSSTVTTLQRFLSDRGIRYGIVGVVLLIIAVPQMFIGTTPASSGHYILTGIGVLLVAVGAITRTTGRRR